MASPRLHTVIFIYLLVFPGVSLVNGLLQKKVGDWVLVFRARSENGQSVVKTYMAEGMASEKTETMPGCVSTNGRESCDNNYRHSVIDKWESAGIKRVKLELYREGEMVAHIVFDGKESTSTSWFNRKNVLSSNWYDLRRAGTDKGRQFSFFGYSNNDIDRRLYINDRWSGGCSFHKGWMMVVEGVTRGSGCNYETFQSYPMFLYNPHTYADFFSNFKQTADVLAIYVTGTNLNVV